MTELFSGILGLVLPPLVELIKRYLPENTKGYFAVALGISFLIGVIAVLMDSGRLDGGELTKSAGIAFAVSQTVYNLYWKDKRK